MLFRSIIKPAGTSVGPTISPFTLTDTGSVRKCVNGRSTTVAAGALAGTPADAAAAAEAPEALEALEAAATAPEAATALAGLTPLAALAGV